MKFKILSVGNEGTPFQIDTYNVFEKRNQIHIASLRYSDHLVCTIHLHLLAITERRMIDTDIRSWTQTFTCHRLLGVWRASASVLRFVSIRTPDRISYMSTVNMYCIDLITKRKKPKQSRQIDQKSGQCNNEKKNNYISERVRTNEWNARENV